MSLDRDPLITVSRDPRDHRRARVRLSALDALAFDTFAAGTRSKIPHPMIAAYMAPGDVVDGKIARSAPHGPAPARIRVTILRTHNASAYPVLERLAAAPRRRFRPDAPPIPR